MLAKYGGPSCLFFGDSHLVRLKFHTQLAGLPQAHKDAFSNAPYMAVGGSTWATILENIKGKKLSRFQKHLGDQWSAMAKNKPDVKYICISLGENDCDQYQQWIMRKKGKLPRDEYWPGLKRKLNDEFDTIKPNIREALDFLVSEFP